MGSLRVWEGAGVGSEGESEAGDDVGVDGIGLGEPTGGASEVPDLSRVHNGSVTDGGHTPKREAFEATGSLHDNADIVLGQ